MSPHDSLLEAAQELLRRIDTCFRYDAEYTGNAGFKEIASALMADGGTTPGVGLNLEGLASAMAEFRVAAGKALADSVDPYAQRRAVRQLCNEHDRRINQCLYGSDIAPGEGG